jgi:hypothetical protein
MSEKSINTFGDARKFILQAMVDVRNKQITVDECLAISKSLESVNHNIQCEINASKLKLQAKQQGLDFGNIVSMGKNIINGD